VAHLSCLLTDMHWWKCGTFEGGVTVPILELKQLLQCDASVTVLLPLLKSLDISPIFSMKKQTYETLRYISYAASSML
jgi:hypothetical protein